MNVNLPVWGYYPKNDEFFVDPMYAPYMRTLAPVKKNEYGGCDESQICELNLTKQQGSPTGFVNPALVRRGWGLDFQLLHPEKDPCPEGWTKGKDGWCVANTPEFGDNGLYSEDAFVPKYQYWDSYAPTLKNVRYRELSHFDQKSVSPWTGDYTTQYDSNIAHQRGKYGYLPAKDSYLA